MFQLKESYTLEGVQALLTKLMDHLGIAEYELATRSGVTPGTIYGILAAKESREVRRSTLRRIAESVGFKVSFGPKTVVLLEVDQTPRARTALTILANEVSNIILASGNDEITKEECGRIKEIVKIMVQNKKA